MTKLEEARLVVEMWQVKADPHTYPKISDAFRRDLNEFERAVRDEEAMACARAVFERLISFHGPATWGFEACRARIAKREKETTSDLRRLSRR